MRNILITNALFYANGPLHLGHMLEAVQADVWARFQRLNGHNCVHISGEDAHGTPIMLAANKANTTPEALIEAMHHEHLQDLTDFAIAFDHYGSTNSNENRELCTQIYRQLQRNNDIHKKVIKQAFDPQEKIFLPDRFIRGTCPRCHTIDQYGDNCESCGATYSPTELIDAVSAISGTRPTEKESEHYFFELANYQEMLSQWINAGHLHPSITNKLKEWFKERLHAWDISRDAPYFGFEIPDSPGKYFYVWLDAPIGYIANFKRFCDNNPHYDFNTYWKKESSQQQPELYHFIGKDIVYFHALFWPAILQAANYRLPTNIFVHGYLTINNKKMSKSRGTFITARKYLEQLDAEYLRYYFCCKLSTHVEDIDLNLQDFMLRINSDLVGKFVNLASRCAGFIHKKFAGKLSLHLDNLELLQHFIAQKDAIANDFEHLNYHKAVRAIMALADQANQYIDQQKPWQLIKESDKTTTVHAVCTQGINLFKVLATYLKPILPITTKKIELFLNCDALDWHNVTAPLLNHTINTFEPLMQRITTEQIDALTDVS